MWRLLVPGLRVKRFLFLVAVGFMALGLALGALVDRMPMGGMYSLNTADIAGLGLFGALAVILGTLGLARSTREVLNSGQWTEQLYSRRHLARGPKIVALGGGTGMPVVLRGLKQYTSNLTAIVTVADDGGSSGRLRGELGILPPGDIRNCLVALADAEPLMQQLFQYRFATGELAGHSFGNLFLVAMEQAAGDFVTALKESSRVLAVRGSVLPATLEQVQLRAELADGRLLSGESEIGRASSPITRVWLEPDDATPLSEAIAAIQSADVIVLGPGSLFTSLIPNLLIRPICEAIRGCSALRIYASNVMTQPGETAGFSVLDHIRALERQVGPGLVDVVLANQEPVPEPLAERYRREGAHPVAIDQDPSGRMPLVVREDLLLVDGLVRHHPEKLARAILRQMIQLRPRWAEGHRLDGLWLENRLKERRLG